MNTTTTWQGSGADVRPCKSPDCKNSYQDDRYGTGKRVKNRCAKGWRCTACGSVEDKAGK
jgi:hypothetical protein